MNPQHTPGPWTAQKDCRNWRNTGILTDGPMDWGIYSPSTRVAIVAEACPVRTEAQVDADAALIAAAPDLLEALAGYIRMSETILPMDNTDAIEKFTRLKTALAFILPQAKAALARAEGRTP